MNWKEKDLSLKQKYKRYHDDVAEYELYTQKKFSLHNAIVFFIYGIVVFFWNNFYLKTNGKGYIICFGITLLSLGNYMLCRNYLPEHKKRIIAVENVYLFLLGKALLSINLIWNNGLSGNISTTLLLAALVMTAMASIVPSHYVIVISLAVLSDMVECIIMESDIVFIMTNFLNDIIIVVFCIGMNIIFSKRQYSEFERKEVLQGECSRDSLTGLYNRRYLERYFVLHAESNKTCAMILLDLDNFKMANDVFGHKKGDEVLCTVSDILRKNFRESDCVARLGGDEFAVFLPNISKQDIVQEKVEKVLEDFPILLEGEKEVEVSVSIGIAFKDQKEMTYKNLCDKADAAMYEAKNLGKARAVIAADNRQEGIYHDAARRREVVIQKQHHGN
jgi:diguanylate cyclase (GGDEF)-like protein